MEVSVLTAAIAAAALVVRVAVLEWRTPGSGRREWGFARDGKALGAGAVAALLLAAGGWPVAGDAAVVWALLTGVLVAYVAHRRPPRDQGGPGE
ncbi:hypothetical protein ACGFMM_31925 [Streptomyces sp. NPDC048604]|uniref:hypothetical protein n=1 Tax=Streptomyces sp. NPDC048604 TaxID=3365578 RepID=UPI003713C520